MSIRDPHTEPERFELDEGPRYLFRVSRRGFIQSIGAGLVITAYAPRIFGDVGDAAPRMAGRFRIDADGTVTGYTGKVNVGQGSRTQISQAVAEEFRVPLAQVNLIMADTAIVPNDGGTYGSLTTPRTIPDVRRTAAAAREALIEFACKQWDAAPDGARLEDGAVKHSNGKTMTLGELAGAMENPEELFDRPSARRGDPFPREDWQVLGKAAAKVSGEAVATGAHRYTSDIKRPNMVYGKVLRAPSYGATLVSIDENAADDLDGVTVVREGDFAGCTASNSYRAQQALDKIAATAEWNETKHEANSDNLYDYLKAHPKQSSGWRGKRDMEKGDVDTALDNGAKVMRAAYKVPYIQHAPMEPRAAVAEWGKNGTLTVWTGTQRPFGVRGELAEAFGLPEGKVRLIVPDTGGGFGGKHTGECAIEAARLAKAAGRPVSLQWSREEEFTWAYFRPAGLIEIAAAIDGGAVTAFDFINYNSGSSAFVCPYNFPSQRVAYQPCESPLRHGSYRGLAAAANNFAREAFIDRLAREVNAEPLQFRLENLDDDRLKDVLQAAADKFGWNKKSADEKIGFGIACGEEKGSVVATCAEVRMDPDGKKYRVTRLCTAFECGAIQNPLNLRAQVDGSVIMGLGAALREEMHFKNGRIQNKQFKNYRVPRFKDLPRLETVLLDRPNQSSVGAGETPIMAVAPAIANAVLAATGHAPEALPVTLA